MAKYVGTITTPWSAEQAFDYMADFSNAEEWDPGVVRSSVLDGTPGEKGATFEVIFKSFGVENRLVYETLKAERPDRVVFRAETSTITSEDVISVSRVGEATELTYDADLTLRGPLRLADPILALFFRRIADGAAAGLRERLAS